jgi:hypothetical protein
LNPAAGKSRRRKLRSSTKKSVDLSGNLPGVGLQREVPGVEDMDLRTGKVALEGLGAGREEERIVLAPHRQKLRLVLAEVGLELRVQGDVALVVAEQVELLGLLASVRVTVRDPEWAAQGSNLRPAD